LPLRSAPPGDLAFQRTALNEDKHFVVFRGSALPARHSLTPLDPERAGRHFVAGDCGSGSRHLDWHYLVRPFPGGSRYASPIGRRCRTGASPWPGVHGAWRTLPARDDC